ncbi:MAG: hypothetical protein F6J87_26050 [Spirulina sp. SIO3F2]|nr:hypothetical protein [Spirulina sp. SIO3F2]
MSDQIHHSTPNKYVSMILNTWKKVFSGHLNLGDMPKVIALEILVAIILLIPLLSFHYVSALNQKMQQVCFYRQCEFLQTHEAPFLYLFATRTKYLIKHQEGFRNDYYMLNGDIRYVFYEGNDEPQVYSIVYSDLLLVIFPLIGFLMIIIGKYGIHKERLDNGITLFLSSFVLFPFKLAIDLIFFLVDLSFKM